MKMSQEIKCSFDVKGFFDGAKQVFPLHEKSSAYKKKFGVKEEKIKKKKGQTWSSKFLKTSEWKELRQKFLDQSEKVCVYCGEKENLQVDHIKPKSKYKELALEWTNLQILCWPCNRTKAAKEVKR